MRSPSLVRVVARRLALSLIPIFALACGDGPDASLTAPSTAAASAALDATAASLAIAVPAPPRPVATTDQKRHLLYEMLIQNVASTSVRIDRIEIADPDHGLPIARFEGDRLSAILLTAANDGTGTVEAGQAALAFFDLAFPLDGRLPRRLTNRLATTRSGRNVIVNAATVDVVAESAARIGPPLRGGNLIDLGGCCVSAHTRALFAFPDGLFLAQRYAIDFVRVDTAAALDGGDPLASGDPTLNESYFTFGADIIAVTGGRITEVRDGIAENIPTILPPFDLDTATGNYVVEALDDGRFALYAHMKTGSVRVRVGDRVRRGEVLGLVGNTGHSDLPHLHFHVMDRPAPLESNGLPYVFDHFDLQATVDLTVDDPVPTFVPPPQQRRNVLPMTGDIVAFP